MPNKLSEKLLRSIASYIEENYVQAQAPRKEKNIRPRDLEECECTVCYPCAPMAASKAMSLEDMLQREDAGFTETLLKLIDNAGKKDSQIYKRAGLTKQHFSKIRNNPNYKPTKPTAIALALALELDLGRTKDLIGRAGYALTNSSKFDLIIQFFIEQKNYNIVQINLALYEFDQSLLGTQGMGMYE